MRPLRALRYPSMSQALAQLPVCQQQRDLAFKDDFFHHLNHAHYLRKGLSIRQRGQLAYQHAHCESFEWNQAYRNAVYGDGLLLWERFVEGTRFSIRLLAASRALPEGDLRICLAVEDEPLHNISFSWMNLAETGSAPKLVPFIARCQGRWRKDTEVQDTFDRCFPQQSGAYVTYAAMQGIAHAIQAGHVLAVRATEQCCFDAKDSKHFFNAYDAFWQRLGGVDRGGFGFEIPVPFHTKPIEQVAAKHRKRSAQRRELWAEVQGAAEASLAPLRPLLTQPTSQSQGGAICQATRDLVQRQPSMN